jgi:hypothetical protein
MNTADMRNGRARVSARDDGLACTFALFLVFALVLVFTLAHVFAVAFVLSSDRLVLFLTFFLSSNLATAHAVALVPAVVAHVFAVACVSDRLVLFLTSFLSSNLAPAPAPAGVQPGALAPVVVLFLVLFLASGLLLLFLPSDPLAEAKGVVPSAAGLLTAAARLLPAADRARYAEEYRSELCDLAQSGDGRLRQFLYALRQLLRVLPMGFALRSPRRRSAAP